MIEVNEYVRTNTGYIAKLKQYLSNTGTYLFDDFIQEIQGDKYRCISENELEKVIVKHSKQLIELIEVGDIVEIRTGLHSIFKYFVENEDNLLLLEEKVKEFWNIETILTHEQFEQNSYKVGGEEDGKGTNNK